MKTMIKNSVDVHTHAFHPKIAEKAIEQLVRHYENPVPGNGLVEDLLQRLSAAGIERAFVHCAATTPDQVIPANNWAIYLQKTYPRLTGFGTIHPGFADWENELARLASNHIRGIKFHPDFQGFWLNDERLDPILRAIGSHFVVMLHVGDTPPPDKNPSCPYKVAQIAHKHPEVPFIAAHLGGYRHWPYVIEALADSQVYVDTSSSLAFIEQDDLNDILGTFPIERILFGSDYPMWDPSEEIRRIHERTDLGPDDFMRILTNGSRLIPNEESHEAE